MPRYFFTVCRPGRVKHDPHGTNLPDVAAALSHAECKIVELRKESPYNDPALVMIVKDEARKMVLFLPFWMLITPDEARRIAASIAKLLTPLKRRHVAKATHGAGMIEFHGE